MNKPDDSSKEAFAEFEAAARRPLALRWKYAFIKTYKPVMDDVKFHAFDTMQDYRDWCDANLPEWLGYRQSKEPPMVSSRPGTNQSASEQQSSEQQVSEQSASNDEVPHV